MAWQQRHQSGEFKAQGPLEAIRRGWRVNKVAAE
jgi:hypothetical protein